MDPVNMLTSGAAMAMELKAAQFGTEYAVSMEDKVLDQAEQSAQAMLKMMPVIPKGDYIDVYA